MNDLTGCQVRCPPMVRLICLLKRKPGMTVEEFRDHWHHHHGPLIRATPNIARHVVRYEQYLPADSPVELGGEFDGVTIMGFAQAEDFLAFVQEDDYLSVIHPDEQSFLDMEGLVGIIVGDPTTVIEGPA
jgi:hypothetical protein